MPQRSHIQTQITLAVDVLRKGGTVAYPTDTVYGLGADGFNSKAVEAVFRAKNRPSSLPVPLLLPDTAALAWVTTALPDVARRLAEAFLPGALTLVVASGPRVPGVVSADSGTVAVRVPDHPVPVALARELGSPIVGTSANMSGQPSPLTAGEVRRQLGAGVDLIIDGGPCTGGVESTVIDCTRDVPVVVREGAVPLEAIEKVCGMSLAKNGEH